MTWACFDLLRIIDLCALQFVGVIDVDGLPGREEVESAIAFAMAVASVFDSAERQVHFCADGRRVDIGDSSLEVADGGKGAVYVFCVERSGEAVVDGVGDLDGIFEGGELDESDYRTKDFFARDAHASRDARKHRGLE